MKILDVGCGTKKIQGAIGMDKFALYGVDVVHDIEMFPFPFSDSTFDEVMCSHILEHVNDVVKTMEELYRITKPGGIIKVRVPYWSSMLSAIDPTHKHIFNEWTFDYFTTGHIHEYYSNARFKIISKKFVKQKDRIKKWIPFRSFLRYFFLNMVDELWIDLQVVK